MDEKEEERLRDIAERDALASRIKEKDKEKTKKMVEDRSSKEGSEARKRRNLGDDKDARKSVLPSIREKSRQQYLKLREQQKLELLRKQVQDEEFLFKDQELTEREKQDYEYNKQVLALAEARLKIDTKEDAYMMPEGNYYYMKLVLTECVELNGVRFISKHQTVLILFIYVC